MGLDDDDPDRLSVQEVRGVFDQMSEVDWKRAERLARVAAAGLRDLSPEDLLQETLVKLLAGERRFPRGRHTLVVLKTAMRSEASNARQRSRASPINSATAVAGHANLPDSNPGVDAGDQRSPEIELIAKDQLDAILLALECDPDALMVAMAWLDGLRGSAAAEAAGLDVKAYDAARKRLMRRLESFQAEGS